MSTNTLIARLEDERQRVWHDTKIWLDTVGNRKMTGEEEQRWSQANSRIDELDERVRDLRSAQDRANDSANAFGSILGQPQEQRGNHGMTAADRDMDAKIRDAVLNRSYAPIESPYGEKRSGYSPAIEQRAALATSGNVGTTFGTRLMAHLVESTSVLAAGAQVMSHDTGEPFKYPKSTADSTAAITAEGAPIGESEPTLSSVLFGSFKYGHMLYVTHELANDASFDLLGHLAMESGRAIGTAFGTDTVTGDGSGNPRGAILDATTGKTGTTGTGTGEFIADDLIDLYHSVASPYARSQGAGWLMKNSTLAAVRKLKDPATGAFLFSLDVPVGTGASGTLLGRPVYVSDAMATVGVSAKSVAFGDWSRYVVRTTGGIRFERSDDFKFDEDIVSFRALARLDGALVDTSAVKVFVGKAS